MFSLFIASLYWTSHFGAYGFERVVNQLKILLRLNWWQVDWSRMVFMWVVDMCKPTILHFEFAFSHVSDEFEYSKAILPCFTCIINIVQLLWRAQGFPWKWNCWWCHPQPCRWGWCQWWGVTRAGGLLGAFYGVRGGQTDGCDDEELPRLKKICHDFSSREKCA